MGTLTISETKVLLERQQRKYLIFIAGLAAVAISLLGVTVFLGLKLNGAYPGVRTKFYVNYGSGKGSSHIEIKVPENATAFTVLEHAAAASPGTFSFSVSTSECNSRYVREVGGVHENPDASLYWTLHKARRDFSEGAPKEEEMTLKGIDDIRVLSGEHVGFMLKEMDARPASACK